jgi:glucosylceramidase
VNSKALSFTVAVVCIVFFAAACQADTRHDTLIVSNKGSYWQTGTIATGSGSATVTVTSTKNQKWLGFAGCFNEKGWQALSKLSSSDRDKAIKLLFDKENGIGFTWGRIPIGASDYALTRYTLNETSGDTGMTHFSIDHDTNYLIPYIKAALAVKSDLKFWASAWTPPTWMKTGAIDADGFDGGVMRNQASYLKANALYTAKFIEAYKEKGITINAVFPQNEPGYTQNYPSCGWGKYRATDTSNNNTEVNETEFLSDYVATYLGPTITERDTGTDIWFGTLSNDTYASAYWSAAKTKAKNYIKGVGLQWNNISLVKGAADSGYLVMQTEHQCGNYPWKSTTVTDPEKANADNFFASYAPNNYAYAQESWTLISNWILQGVNVYSAWNMVLDTGGFNLDKYRKWPQNALLAVNYNTATLKVTPTYYVFRHIAQFLDTGAVRLTTSGGDALAFLNPDSSIVVVVHNTDSTKAVTSIVSVSSKTLQISIPAAGWATLCVNMPSTKTEIKNISRSENLRGMKITSMEDKCCIALPSSDAGHIELLTITGRLLESRDIPSGSREIILSKHSVNAGMLLVRLTYKGYTQTARLFNAR